MENDSKLLRTINLLIAIGFGSVLLFVLVLVWSWRKEVKSKQMIIQQKNEIESLNANLENIVKQRTENLAISNEQLAQYAFMNAHVLRKPIANILGLYEIYQQEQDETLKKEVLKHIDESVKELDDAVHQIQDAVSKNQGNQSA